MIPEISSLITYIYYNTRKHRILLVMSLNIIRKYSLQIFRIHLFPHRSRFFLPDRRTDGSLSNTCVRYWRFLKSSSNQLPRLCISTLLLTSLQVSRFSFRVSLSTLSTSALYLAFVGSVCNDKIIQHMRFLQCQLHTELFAFCQRVLLQAKVSCHLFDCSRLFRLSLFPSFRNYCFFSRFL